MNKDELEFRKITKENYMDCMALTVDEGQKHFVADNTRSLAESAFENGLYTTMKLWLVLFSTIMMRIFPDGR